MPYNTHRYTNNTLRWIPMQMELLQEPGYGVSIDVLLSRMQMHTDTWSLWMSYQ